MQTNPYSLTFGRLPSELIRRPEQSANVIDEFLSETPAQQVFMITGVRGSGKTVFMTDVSRGIQNHEDWIVVELNPEQDLLLSLAAKLSSEKPLAQLFRRAKVNLSFWGFGLEIDGEPPITDIESAISKMLESMRRQKMKLLITVDEVTNSPQIRKFASAFQIFIRQELPVYLLMTGLYENIDALQNENNLTFLHRAPKIELKPLNIGAMADNYQSVFDIERPEAVSMAKSTMGYSFAFQVLGYFRWKYGSDKKRIKSEYKQYLQEYVYEKLWSELSETDRKILFAVACSDDGKIKGIREQLGIDTNHFNPYRKRLIRRGLLNGEVYGVVTFTLPLFKEFVEENYIIDD